MTTPNDAPLTDAEIAAFRELASRLDRPWYMSGPTEHAGACSVIVGDPCVAQFHFGNTPISEDCAAFAVAARNIADRLVREREGMREALEKIGNTAAIHYSGGAFDPEHMKAIATCARTAIDGESFSWDDYQVPHVFNELAAANERIAEQRDEIRIRIMETDDCITKLTAERDALSQQLAEREAERLECNQRADKYDPRDVAMLGGDPSL